MPDLVIDHAAAVHAVLTHPALAALQAGPFRDAWTLEAIHRRPTIALVCQHGRILDALPSALAYDHRHRARFGAMLSVRPLTADDPVHPSRLVAVLDESSPARQRFLAHQRARHARAMQLPLWGPTAC